MFLLLYYIFAGSPRKYQICIQKSDLNDQLNMDVKHRLGRLVVLAIRRGGAVDRSNALAEQRGLPIIEATMGPGSMEVKNMFFFFFFF